MRTKGFTESLQELFLSVIDENYKKISMDRQLLYVQESGKSMVVQFVNQARGKFFRVSHHYTVYIGKK